MQFLFQKMATIGKESHLVSEPEEIQLQRKHKQELLKVMNTNYSTLQNYAARSL